MRSIISMRTLSGLALALAAGALSAQSITVVNMVPRSMSNETSCDGEPSLAVNPANILQMAGSAFTPNPAGGTSAPYYVSTDGGNTWTLNAVMPGGSMTSDVSLRFGSSSNVLYAGILRADNTNLNILRTSGFSLSTPMSILVDRASDDQPFLDARTVGGSDRVYIGNNDFNQSGGKTATVDLSTNAATAAAPAGFAPADVESRATASQDGPSVRAASAPDGRVYAAMLGWRSGTATFVSDVVVVRDDAGGTGSTKFQSLIGSDGLAGTKVATGQNMTFSSQLGSDRVGSSLAIAVDPTDSLTVYVAWGEDGGGTSGSTWTLHLRRSTDGGATWSGDLRTIVGATNPAIAINSAGMVGFFYQQLSGGAWINQADFAPKNDPFTSPTNIVLAQLPDGSTGTCGQPTIGDYSGFMAVGADFYGVFSGDNTPNAANFPHGVTYQRQVNWTSQQLLGTNGTTVVSTSLDPFFFHISGLGGSPTAPAITTQPASTTVAAGSTASFSVAASGTAPLSYQWSKNSAAISGATSSNYTTPATVTADNGSTFTVTVSNSAGTATSNGATLTVSAPTAPSITSQPANATVSAGSTATFSVAASGTAPMTYQWRKNGTAISGATSASYTTPATVSGDNGSTFSAVVTNSAGSATSNNAVLTVNTPPPPPPSTTFSEVEPNNTIATANAVNGTYTAIQGNLTVSTDVDYFALTLTPGQTVAIAMTGPTGPDWDLYLKNSAGTTLTSSTGSTTTENVTYTNSGTTNLTVYPEVIVYNGTSTSPYNLALTYSGGGPVDTTPPTCSASETGTTGSITFSATASDNVGVTKVEFYVDGSLKGTDTASPYTMAFDSTTLANGSHTLVAKAYDAAGNIGSSTSVSFSTSNTTPPPPSGTFNEVEPNDTIATANAVAASYSAIQGHLTVATDVDYFALTLAAGQKVTINMTGPTGADWDLYLKNSAGTTLTSSTGSTTTESVTYTNAGATAITVYPEVIVYSGVSSTPYNLALSYVTPPPSVTYNEVEPNDSIAAANAVPDTATKIIGYISSSTDNDYFAVNVGAGKTLTVGMTGPTGSSYDYDLYFYDASGTTLASSTGSTTTENASWTNSGTATATVYVSVQRYAGSSATIPYNLNLSR